MSGASTNHLQAFNKPDNQEIAFQPRSLEGAGVAYP
jgi:hypothetical protein